MSEEKDKKTSEISEIPESYQRYLDIIYEISKGKRGGWVSNKEIAESLQVEPASVSGMLEKLKSQNLIKWEPRKSIRLTEEGKQFARELDEIHTLLRTFFKDVLKINDDQVVENISCEIEHHITQDVKFSLHKFLSKYLE
ncbi:MAG: metal-dependent transcriptional regulator [Candidatus Lokiarchaeota archaeon]|nr:metal-dependent transcriptional regulator [Candidatus Lokiarchaeota archaeon]